MQITMRYRSIDGCSVTRKFKTIKGARAFADKWVGTPDISQNYAVSFDGVGKVIWQGCTAQALWPESVAVTSDPDHKS